jgi:rsbT co-antagonist protein RsbR
MTLPFFWLDMITLSIAIVITTSILIVALGSGLKNSFNRFFALYILTAVAWAVCNLLMRLALRLELGSPLFWVELVALFFMAIGPLLLMVTVRYVDRPTRWPNLAAGLSLVMMAYLALFPLFRHQVVFNPHFNELGTTIVEFTLQGMIGAGLTLGYMIWALILFWLERRRTREPYLALSVLILAGGFVVGAVLNIPVPVTSITYTLSFIILSYGVIGRQLFNPLRELNEKLQAEIAERQHAEESMRAERNILRTLIDNLPDNIYVKDTQSRFVLNNTTHLRNLGATTPAEVLGKTDLDIFPHELAMQFFADEQRIIQSGQALINRAEMAKDQTTGEELWHLTTKVPLRDNQGNITGLVGISRDITAQKQAEAEHERLQQEIINAQRQAIAELSSPVIPVMQHIIVMPLMGAIDSLRARDITRALLAGITQHQARVVILDITGVPIVDTGVASYLHKTIQAARLKGARVIITGISEAVAETIVDLGIDWSNITTLTDLQTGLVAALHSLGVKLNIN